MHIQNARPYTQVCSHLSTKDSYHSQVHNQSQIIYFGGAHKYASVCVCARVCVGVCVCMRERKKEGEQDQLLNV